MASTHTAENIRQKIINVFDTHKLKIEDCVAAVTDNGINITKAVESIFGKERCVRFYAHTLNLIVSDSLANSSDLNVIIKQIRNVVTHFKHSTSATSI